MLVLESSSSDHALNGPGEESLEWEALQEMRDELMLLDPGPHVRPCAVYPAS